MSYSAQLLPLLLERAGVRRIKSGTYLFPLIQPSPFGEGFNTCVDTYACWGGLDGEKSEYAVCFSYFDIRA